MGNQPNRWAVGKPMNKMMNSTANHHLLTPSSAVGGSLLSGRDAEAVSTWQYRSSVLKTEGEEVNECQKFLKCRLEEDGHGYANLRSVPVPHRR